MRRKKEQERAIERSLREHFEAGIRRVVVPAPEPLPAVVRERGRRWTGPVLRAAAFHTAMAVLIAGSLLLYVMMLPRSTPLRRTLASISWEEVLRTYVPSEDFLRRFLIGSPERRSIQ